MCRGRSSWWYIQHHPPLPWAGALRRTPGEILLLTEIVFLRKLCPQETLRGVGWEWAALAAGGSTSPVEGPRSI